MVDTGMGIVSENDNRLFQWAYNQPAFGWMAAEEIFLSGMRDFPLPPEGNLKWVFRAWLMRKYKKEYASNAVFRPVREAFMLFADERNKVMRHVVEAALITHAMPPVMLGQKLGMDGSTVEAYDALFWNVHDRRADHMFLRNQVYPDTRIEEYFEDYPTKKSLGKHLLRVGYNKDLKSVLFLAGFREDMLSSMDAQQASALFKKTVMVQGLMLAENGFLNFTKHHPTVISAKSIIQANLIGGNEQGGEVSTGTFSDYAFGQLHDDYNNLQGQMRVAAGME
jgi:hypothetical protein